MSDEPTQTRVAIVGGGLSGLTAAKRLADAGYAVDVIEGGNRLGGKINTITMRDGQVADIAAEFIDSDQKNLIDLCKSLNVPIVPTEDTLGTVYKLPNGQVLSNEQFNRAYLPISQQIIADQATLAAEPTGRRAQYLDSISTSQYLRELAATANVDRRPFWNRYWDQVFLRRRPVVVNEQLVRVAEQGFASERGRPAQNISALQFAYEAGKTPDDFIASDCAYRVEGGTKRLIDALRADLESKGVTFVLNKQVQRIDKTDGKFTLDGGAERYDQIVLATQAHTLASIQGLDALGIDAESLDTLQNLQYTHNTKITIKTNKPAPLDGFFVSSLGYQTWNRAPGEVVFLIGDDLPAKYKPKELLELVLTDYAKAHGTTADAMFDRSQVNYNGPDKQKPCYATPAPGQSLRLQRVSRMADTLAGKGIGIVGTYLPSHATAARACGYMAHGVESADRATALLIAQRQETSVASERSWTNRVQQQSQQVTADHISR